MANGVLGRFKDSGAKSQIKCTSGGGGPNPIVMDIRTECTVLCLDRSISVVR